MSAYTVPVFWVARQNDHPGAPARGYADQALLEAVFSRELWTPPDPITYEHHELYGSHPWPDVDGAVVVFSGMMHDTPADSEWLAYRINRLAWSVTIICGDESYKFPHHLLVRNAQHRVWVMAPWPEHEHGVDYRIPGGWYPGTREELRQWTPIAREDGIDVMFAGQVTHLRREQAVAEIRRLPRSTSWVHETDGFMKGVDNATYMGQLAHAKIVVCPSGPITPDTARPISALEAGAIPIVDSRSTHGPAFDYWTLLFGPGHPLTVVAEWSDLRREVSWLQSTWQVSANGLWAWWQQWKRRTVRTLDDHVRHASERARRPRPADDITVVITTSPVPGHPSTDDIELVVLSVRQQLPDAEIIISIDGCRAEQSVEQGDDYDRYVHRLLWLCNFEWHNVLPIICGRHVHQAGATLEAMKLVQTSQILFVEHDTPLVGPIDWPTLYGAIAQGTANVIRLHQDVEFHPDHAVTMADQATVLVPVTWTSCLAPMRRTKVWWQRPHLAGADFYRAMLGQFFIGPGETDRMIEDQLYPIVWREHADNLGQALTDWRLWVYTPDTDRANCHDPELGIRRSGHVDSRQQQQKYFPSDRLRLS